MFRATPAPDLYDTRLPGKFLDRCSNGIMF
jgi:hypothetical protein